MDMGRFNFPWHDYMIGAIGHVILLVVGVAFSFILADKTPSNPDLTLWGWLQRKREILPEHISQESETAALPGHSLGLL